MPTRQAGIILGVDSNDQPRRVLVDSQGRPLTGLVSSGGDRLDIDANGAALTGLQDLAGDRAGVATDGQQEMEVTDAQGATGNATPSEAVLMGADDGTNLQPVLVDASGNVLTGLRDAGGDQAEIDGNGAQLTGVQDAAGDRMGVAADGQAEVEITDAQAAEGAAVPAESVVTAGEDGAGNTARNVRNSPEALDTVFNTAVAADTNILGADVSPSFSPSDFRVTVALDTAAVFNAQLDRGGTVVELDFNQGNQLTAGAVFSFDLPVRSGDSVNFQVETAATVLVLNVDEVPAATA